MGGVSVLMPKLSSTWKGEKEAVLKLARSLAQSDSVGERLDRMAELRKFLEHDLVKRGLPGNSFPDLALSGTPFAKDLMTKITMCMYFNGYLSRKVYCETGPWGC